MHLPGGMRFVWPLLFICPPLWAAPLWLKIGEVRHLAAPPDAVIRVGSRGILRVVESAKGIQLIGLKPGVTALTIDRRPYQVHVVRSGQKEFLTELQTELAAMKGLRLVTDVQPLEIHGTLLRFRDWRRIAELARENGGEFAFKAQALPDAAAEALGILKTLAREAGLPILRFTADPQFTVHVPKGAKSLQQSVRDVFAPFGVRVVSGDGQLMIQPLVRTQVVLAELSRSQSRSFGVEWPSAYRARLVPKPAVPDDLLVTLKALEARGEAQILASPNLICRSGGEARFHAGGEFPIRLVSRQTRDVVWKQHGVILNVRPTADFSGALSIELETEVSLLDMAHAVDGIPALKSNKVKSHFDLAGKRTIALSGLIKQEMGHSRDGLPLFGSLPVLGPLFSSRQFRAEQSELVVFVTPEVQPPAAEASIQMPKGWVTHEW